MPVLFILVVCGVFTHFFVTQTRSANLTSVSVTLSNPRLSFRGSLGAGNTVGSSTVTINTSSNHPSLSTNQLQEGDSVRIGNGATLGSYTVSTTTPNSVFTTTAALASGQADSGDDVIASQSATLTARFTTATAINNGRIRILVPALDSNTDSADGIPDGGKFDFTFAGPSVTCPTDITGYDFVAGTASASAITLSGADYHAFECAYSGTGAVGTAFNGSTNDAIVINSLINPAPASGHTAGTADTYSVIIQQLDSSFTVTDSTTTAIGAIEAVKVTATVAPQITFTIAGVASSTSTCGISTGVTTTATTVPFGDISISSFTNAAQTLTVSTNAVNGYSVTALENDQLGLNGAACTGDNTGTSCIRDSVGDGGAMTHSASAEWNVATNKGFGYSIHNSDANTVPFQYTTATGNCTGTFCARQFADQEDGQSAVQVFSSSTVADSENINMCYRIVANSTTAAGDYQNHLIYNATATF